MRTAEVLESLPSVNREYLENLKRGLARAKAENRQTMAKEYKSAGTGYIKALVDCGVVKEFKPLFCWLTL